MPGDYSCFLCSKNISYAGKKKHLFSKNHLDQIHSGILRKRDALELWIAEYEKGKKSHLDHIPIISLSPGSYYIVCIPCKHIGKALKGHTCSQEAMKQNVEYYKKVLSQPIVKVTTASIETQTIGVPGGDLGVPSDPKEIQKLKTENELLKKQNDILEDKCQKAGLLCDALCYSISYIKEQDREIYQSIMDNLKEDYEGVLRYIKN